MEITVNNIEDLPEDEREEFERFLRLISSGAIENPELNTFFQDFINSDSNVNAAELFQAEYFKEQFIEFKGGPDPILGDFENSSSIDPEDEYDLEDNNPNATGGVIPPPLPDISSNKGSQQNASINDEIPLGDSGPKANTEPGSKVDLNPKAQSDGPLPNKVGVSQGQGSTPAAEKAARESMGAVGGAVGGFLGGISRGLFSTDGKLTEDMSNRLRDSSFNAVGDGPFSQENRSLLSDVRRDPVIAEGAKRLQERVDSLDKQSVESRLSEMQASRLSLHKNTVSDLMADITNSRVGNRELVDGLSLERAMDLAESGDETSRAMAKGLLSNGISGVNPEAALELNINDYKRLNNHLAFMDREMQSQGWNYDDIKKTVADPIESWLDHQGRDDQLLSKLAEYQDEDVNLDEIRKQIEETMKSLRETLKALFSRGYDQAPEQSL